VIKMNRHDEVFWLLTIERKPVPRQRKKMV
jgi:hypothetical protein